MLSSGVVGSRRRRRMTEPQVGGLVSATQACILSGRRRLVVGFGKSLRSYVCDEFEEPRPNAAFHGHVGRIIALCVVGNMRVASLSYDETVRVWGVADGTCLRTMEVPYCCDMTALANGRVVIATYRDVYILVLDRTIPNQVVERRVPVFRGLPSGYTRRVAASADGKVIATIMGQFLHIGFRRDKTLTRFDVESMTPLTTVAVSPCGRRLAIGNSTGQIFVYQDLKAIAKYDRQTRFLPLKYVTSTLHWHSAAVTALRFSGNGSVLYSGGCEGVLVAWKMIKTDFGRKNFRPRLDGAIWGIGLSEDDSTIAVTLADNSVRCIEVASLEIVSTLRGLPTSHLRELPPWDVKVRSVFGSELVRFVPEPGSTGCALISGVGNTVQLYDVFRGVNQADFQVVPRNIVISGVRDNADTEKRKKKKRIKAELATVQHVKVSKDRNYMVTVTIDPDPIAESRFGKSNTMIETLKFWDYASGNQEQLKLLARVDNPHGVNSRISDVAFHPTLPVVATCSSSGSFKLWRAVCHPDNQDYVIFRCELSESYRGFSVNCVAFSCDGSLLATGCRGTVVTWSLVNRAEKYSLPCDRENVIYSSAPQSLALIKLDELGNSRDPYQHLSFVKSQTPYLLCTTRSSVYVWNVYNRTIMWSLGIKNRPECTVSDPDTGLFAVVVKLPLDSSTPVAVEDEEEEEEEDEADTKKEGENETKVDGDSEKEGDSDDEGVSKTDVETEVESKQESKVEAPEDIPDDEKKIKSKKKYSYSARKQQKKRPRALGKAEIEKIKQRRKKKLMCKEDTAVAVFDSMSPAPKSVTRLPPNRDVAGIGFVGNKNDGDNVSKTLFCFDSVMEVVTLPNWDNAEDISDVTTADAAEITEDVNVIGELVGTEAIKCDGAVTQGGALSFVEKAPIRNLLAKYMQGTAVTRPQVLDYAPTMMRELTKIVYSLHADNPNPFSSSAKGGKAVELTPAIRPDDEPQVVDMEE